MRTSSRSGVISPIGRSQRYYPTVTERETTPHIISGEGGKYDSITLSTSTDSTSRPFRELVGRLSQEVRTTTTTGDIRTLRQQVSSGTYKPDAYAIAARMLFRGEEL